MFQIRSLDIDSQLLRGNRAGDPHRRRLIVLAPEGHDDALPLPAIWMLAAHGSSQGGFLAGDPWKESLPDRASRLLAQGSMPPVRLVLPDCFTRYGGSQYLDSPATGLYERHLWEELKPAFESRFATTAHGLVGHSSGGYGAIVQAMRHPEHVSAVACHAGDMMFEFAYLGDFPRAAAAFKREGGPEKFLAAFLAAPKKQDNRWFAGINTLAMAACYSPDDASPLGVALPFDLDTCELRTDVWARWLEHDPVRMIDQPRHQDALRGLRLLFIDAGNRDEFHLHWGARTLRQRLSQAGISHVHEEFDDGHGGTAYRFDRSLPLVARALC